MSKQEIFEFLRDNLSLTLDEDCGRDYGRPGCGLTSYKSFNFKLKLKNPETGEDEVLSSETISIDDN